MARILIYTALDGKKFIFHKESIPDAQEFARCFVHAPQKYQPLLATGNPTEMMLVHLCDVDDAHIRNPKNWEDRGNELGLVGVMDGVPEIPTRRKPWWKFW